MKTIEQKIAAIKQSIETATGKECLVTEGELTVDFQYWVKHIDYWVSREVAYGFLNLLPIGDKTDEWVPVSEKPAIGTSWQIHSKLLGIHTSFYDGEGKWTHPFYTFTDVTHYRPLPSKPTNI